ncbi:unnamed protein product [Paramecium primaurelia]|uniref:Protein kinase domain-containing protein n=1 Tax=Paramecium primaurelia TaxID=5886 RepID=A0A8S1KHI6_PARPR|nr:unnamed protein product [Paramecium primaurelia]
MKHDFLKEKELKIIEKIGEGAFGQVFKGLYKGEEVAIKSMQGAQLQETSIMESLKHKNIIKFYKYLKQGNNQYLVMEYAGGGSLSDYMKQSLDEETISCIMKSIFGGIEYLHSKQIIHRDIKPDNILIKYSDDLSSVKIADFGLSYQYMPEIRYYQTVSQQCGTFIFMAPEQILNKSYNKAVDMWSCGVVLFMLLNQGKHPFYPRISTKKEFINSFPDLKYEQPLHASPLARDLLQRLLQYDQDSRYTAAQALVHPWITRNFNNPIPMSVKEFGTCQELKKKFFQFFKAVLFLNQVQQDSIKQSPIQSKTDLGDFKISIVEFDEDNYDQECEDTNSPKNQQFFNKLSIQRPSKILKSYRTLNNIPYKGKHYQLNAILNQTNESPIRELKKIKLQQQFSIDNEQFIIPIDPESPKKNLRGSQSNKLLLPALTESTQISLSPIKQKQKPLIKQNSFRKSDTSFFMGLNRMNNDSALEPGTLRNRVETYDKTQIPVINTQRFYGRNTITNLVISPKNNIATSTNLLIPKKII